MNRDEFMELVYETFADEPDNVLANGIIEAADAYVEHEKAQLSQEVTTSDMISRQDAIDAFEDTTFTKNEIRRRLSDLPPAQPEVLACGNGELVAHPEPTDIDAKEAVYNLAEKIGIHQLFALTVELRGEPIQPEPQEGHWIKHESPDDGEQYECSECGVLWEFNDGTPEDNEAYFCPKCGAKMTTSTK